MPVENPSDVARDMFGWAVATADFDGDGFDDLGVTMPGEDLGDDPALVDRGAVHTIYGSSAGLTADGDRLWSQDSPEVAGRGNAATGSAGRSPDSG